MTDEEGLQFEEHPFYQSAVILRKYDDMGKVTDIDAPTMKSLLGGVRSTAAGYVNYHHVGYRRFKIQASRPADKVQYNAGGLGDLYIAGLTMHLAEFPYDEPVASYPPPANFTEYMAMLDSTLLFDVPVRVPGSNNFVPVGLPQYDSSTFGG